MYVVTHFLEHLSSCNVCISFVKAAPFQAFSKLFLVGFISQQKLYASVEECLIAEPFTSPQKTLKKKKPFIFSIEI